MIPDDRWEPCHLEHGPDQGPAVGMWQQGQGGSLGWQLHPGCSHSWPARLALTPTSTSFHHFIDPEPRLFLEEAPGVNPKRRDGSPARSTTPNAPHALPHDDALGLMLPMMLWGRPRLHTFPCASVSLAHGGLGSPYGIPHIAWVPASTSHPSGGGLDLGSQGQASWPHCAFPSPLEPCLEPEIFHTEPLAADAGTFAIS